MRQTSVRAPGGAYRPIKERMIEMVANEDFSEFVIPLDFLILDLLPDEGTEFAGLYQLGETTAQVWKKLGVKELPKSGVNARVTSMNKSGLLTKIKALGRESGAWQKSALGKEALEKWRAKQQ